MMAEYIDRGTAIAKLNALEVIKPLSTMTDAKRLLADMSAADVAPVVRCRDCKYYHWEQEPCHGRTEHYCALHKGLTSVTRDSFCSYGISSQTGGARYDKV